MRYHTISILGLIALVASASPLAAQAGNIQGGTTIRATLTTGDHQALVGTLVTRSADSLVMVPRGAEGLVRLPSSSIRSIDVLNGKDRVRTAIRWGVIGGGIWGVVATMVPFEDCHVRRTQYCANSRGAFVGLQAASKAVMTGVVGAFRGEDRWVRVEGSAPTAFIAPSSGRVSAGLRVGL